MTILDKIFARKLEEIEASKSKSSLLELKSMVLDAEPTRGFREALARSATKPALIAEVKKGSPSEGTIRENFDAAAIAQSYQRAGATCLSVLTDVDFFQGSLANLSLCREAVTLPLLRKDFTADPYQVYEARAYGADAILLIAAMLEPDQLRDLSALAAELDLDVLLEVHNEAEAEIAVDLRAPLIGVNNRDLSNFRTDLATTERLAPLIIPSALLVSESALKTNADVRRAELAGAGAVLIGTVFCAAVDIEEKVREVMAA